MPVATPTQYREMFARARAESFAYPAINISSSETAHAVLQGLAESKSDGILQIGLRSASYLSGSSVDDRIAGTIGIAAYIREIAENYPVLVGIHTDHCQPAHLDSFLIPLVEASERSVQSGGAPLFSSHMWDGSSLPVEDNLAVADALLDRLTAIGVMLEVEVGTVGGEEDGVKGSSDPTRLFTAKEDAIALAQKLGLGERGRYLTAFTFGNVHGLYRPGNVVLDPSWLDTLQGVVSEKFGVERPFDLVFHGGSGSSPEDVRAAVRNGVVKMNIDSETQYEYVRVVADYMKEHYDAVVGVNGEVGQRKLYDARVWGAAAETAMARRVGEYAAGLGSAGRTLWAAEAPA